MIALPSLPLAAFSLKSPSGPAWEFLVLFLVVIVGPPLLERSRLPGIIGLLIGGYLIGPNAFDVIGAGNTTVPELGQLGLLYLMFIAGVELDLTLLRMHQREVLRFASAAFMIPMGLGFALGLLLGWSALASLLLGALVASHTLLTYSAVREAGLSAHPAIATAVGATVLTDTAALVVLAAVAGTQVEGESALSITTQIAVGLLVLSIFSLVILPRLVRLGFRYLGTDRVIRYLLAVASFLAAATVAGVLGIEGLVGAFFAGLGLNRLVPNEGPLMERIDFFGSAVFVPVFLVSVGMLLKPSVMIQPETLKLAALFIVVSVGGKGLAVLISKRSMRLTASETTLMLGVTIPQAAATLAATVIGYDTGLFDQSVVNAALVLILVTVVAATFLVERSKLTVTGPTVTGTALGKRILVALENPEQAPLSFAIGAKLAAPDAGIVRALLGSSPSETSSRSAHLDTIHSIGFAEGIDVDPGLLIHTSLADAIVNAVALERSSFVLMGQQSATAHAALGGTGEAVAASITTPVGILLGDAAAFDEVVLAQTDEPDATNAADVGAEVAVRLAGRNNPVRRVELSQSLAEQHAGQLLIVPMTLLPMLAITDPPPGAALMLVANPRPDQSFQNTPAHEERR